MTTPRRCPHCGLLLNPGGRPLPAAVLQMMHRNTVPAVVLQMLANRFGRYVAREALIERIYAGSSPPLTVNNAMSVRFHEMRKLLRPHGLEIVSSHMAGDGPGGYMLRWAKARAAA